ncbi:MAG: N-6 DNA methylase [Myxococcota bacterium]
MDSARRLTLGQWYTPAAVADLALSLALGGQRSAARVLDPTCGDGAFLARAQAAGLAAERIVGVELDPDAARAAQSSVPGTRVICGDLFAIADDVLGGPVDAVVGNPPYVRQERLSGEQKARIRRRLTADWPELVPGDVHRLSRRGDLAAACILRALHFVRPGGRVALVVSSALVDAAYAAPLWRSIARVGRVLALVDAPDERWFADAAINALILVIERGTGGPEPSAQDEVAVARLTVSTAAAASRIRDLDDLNAVAEVRPAPHDRPGRWSAHLRAPRVWFDFERAAGSALVPLAAVADLRRGVTSGANDVFYLSRARAAELDLEADVLAPLLRTPRDRGQIAIDPAASTHLALVCPPHDEILAQYPNAKRYLDRHSERADQPTLRSRKPWWALPVRPARLFLTKAYSERFVQRLASASMVADQRVYALYPVADVPVRTLAAVLNSTFTALALESLGRSSMGEGALEWTAADAKGLPILDPRVLDPQRTRAVCAALDALSTRPIAAIAAERARSDRRCLDLALAKMRPGLVEVLDALWPALVAAVGRRTSRRHRPLRSSADDGL